MAVRPAGRVAGALAAAIVVAGLAWGLVAFGAKGVLIPVGLVGAWWLSSRPPAALAVLVGSIVVFETDTNGFLPATHRYYVRVVGGRLAIYDLLLVVAVVAVLLDRARHKRPLLGPGRATMPLLLLGVACMFGEEVGRANGGNSVDALNSLHVLAFLILVPFVVVNTVRTRPQLEAAAKVAAGLVVFKAAEGLAAWAVGAGRPINGTRLIYYEPAPNFVLVLFLLTAIGVVVARGRLPRWAVWATPVVLATLVLSFRRSFWIAAALGAVVVVLAASGRRGRPFVVLGGVALVLALTTAVRVGGATDTHNSIVRRAYSLSPTKINASADDRYRLDEQKNVILAIRSNPATGIGLGVPWTIARPLPAVTTDGVYYTHVVVFWYWLKLGPLGVIAYGWLNLAAIGLGFAVWRRYPHVYGRAAGLACAAGVIGLAVAETTGSFTGVDLRLTIVLGSLIGLLAAAERLAGPGPARPRTLRPLAVTAG